MKIEDQVCSLELAKRLEELGVKQESYFYHHWYKKNRDYEYIDHKICAEKIEEFDDGKWKLKVYSAFTVAELGEILPANLEDKYLTSHKCSRNGWWIFYSKFNDKDTDNNSCWSAREPDARAKMLIYLIENNLIKVDEIK